TWTKTLLEAITLHVGRPLGCPQTSETEVGPTTEPKPVLPSPTIAQELKRLLNEARTRPEDIAEDAGIDPRTVYRHLSGDSVPSLRNTGAYERAISKRLKRDVKLPVPVKRQ